MLLYVEEEVRDIHQVTATSEGDQGGRLPSTKKGASERGAGVEDEPDASTDVLRTHGHIILLTHLWVTSIQ
jgi:hypothetical protein